MNYYLKWLLILLFSLGFGNRIVIAEAVDSITFFHDVPEWQEIFLGLGELSAREARIRTVPTVLGTHVYKSRIKIDLSGSNAPAIFKWWFGYRARKLLATDQIADLSDVWDKVEGNYSPGIRQALTQNGVVYGFPLHISYWVWYYNKPLYRKYGLSLPKTWNELMKQLRFFKSKGIYGIGNAIGRHPNRQRWMSFIVFQEILYRIDADFYTDLMNGKVHWTDAKAVRAMKIWKKLLDDGYFAPTDITFGEDLPRMFKEGKLAFAPFGDWYGGILQRQGLKPGRDFDLFVPPAITPAGEGAIVLEISPLVAGKNSPGKDLAKKWFEWYGTSRRAAVYLWDNLKTRPTLHVTPDLMKEKDPTLVKEQLLVKSYPKKLIRFWEATPVEIVEYAVDEFYRMLADSDRYMEVLDNIEKKAKKTWPSYDVRY
ncbi:MAG: extracellular solute-binding protein [Proteobacteria bacterium]|nr:extracellular solute-binding protein [Pseudomonadota bacterium]